MTQVALALARRAVRNAMRRPQFLAPLVAFPTLFLAVNVGGLTRTTDLPGFPEVDGFLDFQLAAAITQSLLLGGVASGIAVALEIEGGFFDRLVTAPIPRAAIVFGPVLGAGVIAVAQVAWFLIAGLLFGASIQAGPLGVLSVVAIGVVAGIGFAAIGILLALRARNASTVQGIFPLVFVVLFISSAFFPENLLSSPADTVAAYNPLSYVADGMREPIAYGSDLVPVLEGQTVQIRDGVLFVDGRRRREAYVDDSRVDGFFFGPVRVPRRAVYVLGDNRATCEDSRDIGAIPRSELIGRVDLRISPPWG